MENGISQGKFSGHFLTVKPKYVITLVSNKGGGVFRNAADITILSTPPLLDGRIIPLQNHLAYKFYRLLDANDFETFSDVQGSTGNTA